MTLQEGKEQLQDDILSILEGFGIDEAMDPQDYHKMVNALCNAVIENLNKIKVK